MLLPTPFMPQERQEAETGCLTAQRALCLLSGGVGTGFALSLLLFILLDEPVCWGETETQRRFVTYLRSYKVIGKVRV